MKLTLKNVFLSVGITIFSLVLFSFVSVNKAEALTCTAQASAAWNVGSTWTGGCGGTGPVGGDTVTITSFNVTIPADAAATTLTLAGTATLTSVTNALTISGDTVIGTGTTLSPAGGAFSTGTLSVSGTLNLGTGASTVATTTIVNSGGTITLSGASGQKTFSGTFTNNGTYNETVANGTGITFSNTLGNAGTFTTSTGGHTFSGAITNTGVFNNAVPGSSMTNLAASTVGTFNYTTGAQTVQLVNYYNLGLSGSGSAVKTIGVFTVLNNLVISGTAQAFLTGDSTAKSLTLGATPARTGTWGSTSSIATYKNDTAFASTGKVAVATSTAKKVVYADINPGGGTTTTTTTSTGTVADVTPPSGTSVSINAGALTASSLSTTLTFTAIDATEMIISEDAGFAGATWETNATSKPFAFTGADGVKTVYAKFRDATGNMSSAVSDSITVSGSGVIVINLPPIEPTQGCSAGNLYNVSTGALCVNNAGPTIPGCGNGTTGFSTASGLSCALNRSVSGSYSLGTVTLKNGSRGAAVMELQRFLNDKLGLGLVVDGKLGPKTIAVIKKWQKDNGLVADGLVGAKTKAQMNAQ